MINVCHPDLLIPEPNFIETLVAVGKLKMYKLLGFDYIPSELTEVDGNSLRSELDYLINIVLNEREFLQ